jgi:hypothetical protein
LTFRAADLAINGQQRQFLEYSSSLPQTVDPVQATTLDVLMAYASRFPITLRWAMLLHDIAKDRYPRAPKQSHPNPEGHDHPTLCSATARAISDGIVQSSIALGEYRMDSTMKEIVLWLVQNHDILGNMFTGERAPRFLLNQTHTPGDSNYGHCLSLLQVVTLCDLWATADGRYLTEQKARYWLSLNDRQSVIARQQNLYNWRVLRWTGDLVGRDDLEAAAYVEDEIGHSCPSAESVFGQGIDYVVYGFYLFTTLLKEELTTLLSLIAYEYNNRIKNHQSITLAFDKFKPWEPDTAEVLESYREQIKRRELDCEYDSSKATLRVVALRDQKDVAKPDVPEDV